MSTAVTILFSLLALPDQVTVALIGLLGISLLAGGPLLTALLQFRANKPPRVVETAALMKPAGEVITETRTRTVTTTIVETVSVKTIGGQKGNATPGRGWRGRNSEE